MLKGIGSYNPFVSKPQTPVEKPVRPPNDIDWDRLGELTVKDVDHVDVDSLSIEESNALVRSNDNGILPNKPYYKMFPHMRPDSPVVSAIKSIPEIPYRLEMAWHKVKELVCGNQDEIYDNKRGDWVPPRDRR
jgi:hypothetical protein